MINDINKYFIEEENQYRCQYPLTIVRIKQSFFEKGLSEEVLDEIDSIGIFYIYFYKDLDISKGPEKTLLCSLPMSFKMCPSEKINTSEDGEPVLELRFYQNDIFMKARSLIQHVRNVEKGMDLLYNNFMPKNISYSGEFELLKDCKNLNKIGLGMSDQTLALIVAEANRDPKNINRAFRFALRDNPKLSEFERHVIRIVDLARLNDPFMGLASAHASRSLTVGIANHRLEKEGQITGKEDQGNTGIVVDAIK